MLVNLTVTVGQLLQIGLTVGGLVAVYIGLEKRLTAIETKIDPMWRQFDRRRSATGTTGQS